MEAKGQELVAKALAWLDARPTPPPPELRQRMAEAMAGVSAGTVPGALAEGALACLQTTVAAPQERATALDLLAADALLTYALEAAAEIGAAALRDMTQSYGPDTLATLLPEDSAPGAEAGQARTADTQTHGHTDSPANPGDLAAPGGTTGGAPGDATSAGEDA